MDLSNTNIYFSDFVGDFNNMILMVNITCMYKCHKKLDLRFFNLIVSLYYV